MGLIALECQKCGASLQVDAAAATYTCKYCHTAHERDYSGGVAPTPHSLRAVAERAFDRGEFGKAMQFIEQGLTIDPHHKDLLALESKTNAQLELIGNSHAEQTAQQIGQINLHAEAEQYSLKAQFILSSLQANKKVYGSNSALTGATPANVDLAIQYIDRSLENFPENPVYLNTKALLLWEGKGDKVAAQELLERAASINPRDIDIQNNLAALRSSPCFIATAAFGTPMAAEVDVLRAWRDQFLARTFLGRAFITAYYNLSPPIASFIAPRPAIRRLFRALLRPLLKTLSERSASSERR